MSGSLVSTFVSLPFVCDIFLFFFLPLDRSVFVDPSNPTLRIYVYASVKRERFEVSITFKFENLFVCHNSIKIKKRKVKKNRI